MEADLSDELSGNLGGVLLINSYKKHIKVKNRSWSTARLLLLSYAGNTSADVTGHNCRDVPDKTL